MTATTPPSRWATWRAWAAERRTKLADASINIRRAFALVFAAHPGSASAMAVCTLVGALLPAGQAWIGKLIVVLVAKSVSP